MKHITILAFGLACAGAHAQSPLAWWKFDEAGGGTAFATVGGVNGTLAGGASFVGGVAGNAISVSTAASGFVNFGNNYGLLGTDYTLSFWVNTTTTSTDQLILGKHRGTVVSGYFVGLSANGPYGAPNKVWGYQGSAPGNQPISTTSVNDGVWHHVAVAYALGTGLHSIYVDGAPAEDTRSAAPMAANTADFMVGGIHDPGGTPVPTFTGLVDDLQIYDARLTDTDITFLFDNPGQALVPEPSSLIALGFGGLLVLGRLRRRR